LDFLCPKRSFVTLIVSELRDLISNYGLSPHSTLAPGEMCTLIDQWLSHVPCPASNSVERMWRRDATARSRTVEVARLVRNDDS
jgi:hypothetical protein